MPLELLTVVPVAALVEVVIGVIMALFTIAAVLLTVVILLQEGKGGGLAGAFGGAGAEAFGVKAGTVNTFTAWLGAAFLGLALLHAGLQQKANPTSIEDDGTRPGASSEDDGNGESRIEEPDSGDGDDAGGTGNGDG